MIDDKSTNEIKKYIQDSSSIVVIQADNPDADSLGSALALEGLLESQKKNVTMYCSSDMPSYLRYLDGWDRVTNEMPRNFDLSIIVDASTVTLLQNLNDRGELPWLAAKPCIVIDHHTSTNNLIEFANVLIVQPSAASTGILIHELAGKLDWEITPDVADQILTSILGDTQGLSNDLASADTYRVVAELIDRGADRPALEEKRRLAGKMPKKIYTYKAQMINNTEFVTSNLASVSVSQAEIKEFSSLYNPGPLIQNDLLQTEDVEVVIVFKIYDSKRVTASIRCNNQKPIANKLAEHFGGGGHPYAAGFKQENVDNPVNLRKDVYKKAIELMELV